MKNIIVGIVFMILFAITASGQNIITDTISVENNDPDLIIVDASCGQCNFNLSGEGCDLAVRISGLAYFVDGTKIDDHGNAHASDGFCQAVRKARVKGHLVDNRFQLQYFQLIPLVEEE